MSPVLFGGLVRDAAFGCSSGLGGALSFRGRAAEPGTHSRQRFRKGATGVAASSPPWWLWVPGSPAATRNDSGAAPHSPHAEEARSAVSKHEGASRECRILVRNALCGRPSPFPDKGREGGPPVRDPGATGSSGSRICAALVRERAEGSHALPSDARMPYRTFARTSAARASIIAGVPGPPQIARAPGMLRRRAGGSTAARAGWTRSAEPWSRSRPATSSIST